MELIPGLPNDIAVQCLIRVPYQDFPSISSVCRSWKALLHLPHFFDHRKLSGFSKRVIIMAQARQKSDEPARKKSDEPYIRLTLYEPQTGIWTKVPSIPYDYDNGLHMFFQVVSVGYNVVLMGGWDDPVARKASPKVFIYNFVSGTWSRGSNMPGRPRSSFACASDNKRTIFIAGGFDDDKNALKSALSYDVENDKWTTLPDMAHDMARKKSEGKGFFQQGKFHIIDSYIPKYHYRYGKSAQVFDVEKWAWDEVEEHFLKYVTCPGLYVIGANGKMYMCYSDSRKVGILGEGVGEFRLIATVPRKKVRIPTCMIEYDGNLLVMGEARNRFQSEACVLDLKSSVWTEVERPFEYSTHIYSHCCLEM